MNYKEFLQKNYESYKNYQDFKDYETKLEYIGRQIFDFTTYQSDMDEYFASKMLKVCEVILNNQTYDYIEDKNNLINYLTMVNMPFLSMQNKLEWGTSIRGAWFNTSTWNESKNIYINCNLTIPRTDWILFITELIEWSKE